MDQFNAKIILRVVLDFTAQTLKKGRRFLHEEEEVTLLTLTINGMDQHPCLHSQFFTIQQATPIQCPEKNLIVKMSLFS